MASRFSVFLIRTKLCDILQYRNPSMLVFYDVSSPRNPGLHPFPEIFAPQACKADQYRKFILALLILKDPQSFVFRTCQQWRTHFSDDCTSGNYERLPATKGSEHWEPLLRLNFCESSKRFEQFEVKRVLTDRSSRSSILKVS